MKTAARFQALAMTLSRPMVAVALLWMLYVLSRIHMAGLLYRTDLDSYFGRIEQGGVFAEYGPVANLLIWAPSWLAGATDRTRYFLGFKALGLLVDAALFSAVLRRVPFAGALLFVMASALLRRVWLDRLDLYIGALLSAYVLWQRRAGMIALVTAALIKFPFLALGALPALRHRRIRSIMPWFCAVGVYALVLVLAWLVKGSEGSVSQFGFHSGRTLQMESLLGNILYMGKGLWNWPLTVSLDHGAAHIHTQYDQPLMLSGQAILVGGVAVTGWHIWLRGIRLRREMMLLLSVMAYTAFNPVGSPQFAVVVVMLLPWAYATAPRAARLVLWLLLPYAWATDMEFFHYPDVFIADLRFGAWVMARNALLVLCWALLMSRFVHPGRLPTTR
jgi:hypothetical protein